MFQELKGPKYKTKNKVMSVQNEQGSFRVRWLLAEFAALGKATKF